MDTKRETRAGSNPWKGLMPRLRIRANRWKLRGLGERPRRVKRGAVTRPRLLLLFLPTPTLMTAGTIASPHRRREAGRATLNPRYSPRHLAHLTPFLPTGPLRHSPQRPPPKTPGQYSLARPGMACHRRRLGQHLSPTITPSQSSGIPPPSPHLPLLPPPPPPLSPI